MAPKDHKSYGKQNSYTKKNMKVVKNYKNHQNRASKSDKSEILKKKCMVDWHQTNIVLKLKVVFGGYTTILHNPYLVSNRKKNS